MSLRGDMSLNEVRMEPQKAQAGAIPEKNVWKSIDMQLQGNAKKRRFDKLKVVAERPLKIADSSRELKLGTIRKWAIGFFDMAGAGAFSEVMDLYLDDGCLEGEAKPAAVEEYSDDEPVAENGREENEESENGENADELDDFDSGDDKEPTASWDDSRSEIDVN